MPMKVHKHVNTGVLTSVSLFLYGSYSWESPAVYILLTTCQYWLGGEHGSLSALVLGPVTHL